MTDIVERLRYCADAQLPTVEAALEREAASEIERLRAFVEKVRKMEAWHFGPGCDTRKTASVGQFLSDLDAALSELDGAGE